MLQRAVHGSQHAVRVMLTYGRIIARGSPMQVLGPYGRAYEPTRHWRDNTGLCPKFLKGVSAPRARARDNFWGH